jgi:WD40-like Beta Propeller Repeat
MKRARSPRRLFLASAACATLGCGDGTRIVLGASQVVDAGTDLGAFGPPVIVSELAATGFNDLKESLRGDLLEIYFCSDRPGGPGNQDMWSATRANKSEPWGAPSLVAEVSSTSHETGTALSAEGLTLWLASDRPGGKGGFDIYVSTRPNPMTPWSTPAPVTELNTTSDEFPRVPALSGLMMPPSYAFTKYQYQTFLTSRPNAGAPWTKPTSISELDTANIDTDAFLTQDGLVLYFSTDRIAAGDQDLFVTSRPDLGSPFGTPTALSELNVTGYQDRDPWLSPDGHEIYFSSDRGGTLKIYRATR